MEVQEAIAIAAIHRNGTISPRPRLEQGCVHSARAPARIPSSNMIRAITMSSGGLDSGASAAAAALAKEAEERWWSQSDAGAEEIDDITAVVVFLGL